VNGARSSVKKNRPDVEKFLYIIAQYIATRTCESFLMQIWTLRTRYESAERVRAEWTKLRKMSMSTI